MLPSALLTSGLMALHAICVDALEIPTPGKIPTRQQATFGAATGRFIVEYDTSSLTKRDIQDSLTEELASNGVDVSVNSNFDSDIFQGVSITVSGNTTAEDLKTLNGIKNAWPATVVTLDDDIVSSDVASWNPHLLTGVQTLHDNGNTGAGVKIAIIDTGVDYTHPALGGGIGDGYPITHGWDFSEDTENPTSDPMDCAGHGTFVSSLIISSDETNLGVAPGASISMYKVFGCSTSTYDDIIMAGMIKAYEEKPDIMTLSLGANRGFNTIPIAELASRMSKDIVVMFAAGNSGEEGVFYASSGASGIDVLAIGSSHAKQYPGYKAIFNSSSGDSYIFGYAANSFVQFEVEGTFSTKLYDSNACLLSEASSDDSVLIAKRGGCYYGNLFNNLNTLGYKTALVYAPDSSFTITKASILDDYTLQNVGVIKQEVGDWVIEQVEAGYEVSVTFSKDFGVVGLDTTALSAGQVDYYTSWGPTYENNFFPHVNAPGGEVFGAVIGGGWAGGSGTSFATPYVAGVVALYLSEHPGADPAEVRKRLISTASLLPLFDYEVTTSGYETSSLVDSLTAPLIQQGAGLIDAAKFVQQNTVLTSSPTLELNDTVNRVDSFTISLRNDNDEAVSYEISHVASVTVYARSGSSEWWIPNLYYPPYDSSSAQVVLGQDSITLAANSEGSFEVKISAPEGVNSDVGPVFAGKIHISGGNGDQIEVPYMGVEYDTYEWTPFPESPMALYYDTETGYLYNLTSPDHQVNFTFTDSDSPEIYYNLRYGTEVLSFEIVDADYDINDFEYPLPLGNGVLGPIMTSVDAYGDYAVFPLYWQPSFYSYSYFHSQGLADGSVIPDGTYRILSYALKMFGDRSNRDDWLISLSDPFQVSGNLGNSTTTESSIASSESAMSSSEEPTESLSSSSSLPHSLSSSPSSSATEEPSSSASSDSASNTAIPSLQGLDIITNIEIVDKVTGTTDSYLNDWFEIRVTLYKETPIEADSFTEFAIPGFTDGPSDSVSLETTSGELFGYFTYSGDGVYKISYDGITSFYGDLQGTFTFTVRLDPSIKAAITSPQSRDFVAYTPEQTFTNTLDFVKLPSDAPFRTSFWDGSAPRWFIDVPGTLGPWTSISLSSISGDYLYSFLCDEITTYTGTELDEFGNATVLTKGSSYTSDSNCGTRGLTLVFDETVSSDEVLRIEIPAEIDMSLYYYENTMSVIVTSDSGSETFTFSDTIRLYSNGDYSVFGGSRYVAPTTSSSSSVSAEESTSSDEVVSSEESISSEQFSAESTSSLADVSSESSESSSESSILSDETPSDTSSSSTISSTAESNVETSSDMSAVSTSQASSTSSFSSSSASSTSTEPVISGSLENGALKWVIDVPGSVGPWTSVEIEGSGDSGFTFTDVKYVVDHVSYSVNSTDLTSFDFLSELYSENGFRVEFNGRIISGSSFTVKAKVSVTIPDNKKLAKREVLTWELESVITLDDASSESSSASSESSTSSSETSIESSDLSSQSSTASSVETSQTTSLDPSSTDASVPSSTTAVSTTTYTSTTSSVISSSSGTEVELGPASGSSSVASQSSISSEEQASSTLTSSATSELLSSSGSNSGTISSLILSTSETTTDASSSESEISPSAGSSILTTTTTENDESTTVVTITSCSETVCTESITTAAITTVVTTINNVVTTYTTYCPLTDTTSVTVTEKEHKSTDAVKRTDDSGKSTSTTTVGGANTIVKTVTSCSAGVCHTTTVSPDSTAAGTSTVVTPAVVTGSGSGSGSVENLENIGEDVGTNGATGTGGATTTVAAAGTTQATEANGNVGGNTQDTTSTVTEAVTKTRVFASGVNAPSAILSATPANPAGSLVTVPTMIQPKSTISTSEGPNESTSTTSSASTFATTAAITTYEGVGSNIKVSGLFTVISSIILMFVF